MLISQTQIYAFIYLYTFKHKHECWCKEQRKENLISYFTVTLYHIIPTKRFWLLKQILKLKAVDLFQCVRAPRGQYTLQGSLLTKVKTESSNSSTQALILFKITKLRLVDVEF